MYILNRTISPYMGAAQLLGIYHRREVAEVARNAYIDRYQSQSAIDPWAEQAYYEVNLEKDTQILTLTHCDEIAPNATHAWVLNRFTEGFGQIIREYEGIFASEASASAFLQTILETEEEKFPTAFEIEKVTLSRPLSDTVDWNRWFNKQMLSALDAMRELDQRQM